MALGASLPTAQHSTRANGEAETAGGKVGDKQPTPAQRRILPTPDFASKLQRQTLIQMLAALFLDSVEWALDAVTYERKQNFFLTGNYSPVSELPSVDSGLKISGKLPSFLDGEYVRVGPNPMFEPSTGYHWFDGDGMIHAVRFSEGGASYVNRYVKTNRLMLERTAGRPVVPKIGQMKGFTGLARLLVGRARQYMGLVDLEACAGTANTAVMYHAGSLLALHEGDMPYVVRMLREGELQTLGRLDYGGKLDHSLSAHPKLDPVTGELYTFGYNVEKPPYLIYHVVSAAGELGPKIPITLPEGVMIHDFAITEKQAIFMDLPYVFDLEAMVCKHSLPFVWKERPARFGLLPREDTSEANIRWYSLPPCFIFHIANAWEEGEETVMVACRYDRLDINSLVSPCFLTEFRFNATLGTAKESRISNVRCEFPRINEGLVGRKCRFVYTLAVDGDRPTGVAKFDLSKPHAAKDPIDLKGLTTPEVAAAEAKHSGIVAGLFQFGAHRFGSEPVFVPQPGAPLASSEDEGCLLTLVFDELTKLSELLVINARTMDPSPLAVVHLNVRVPYGFHGTYVTQKQMEEQVQDS